MLNDETRKELEKQQYRLVGNHSAVKICGWTKKMIKGEGCCYKERFYGIMSNQCLQMTTALSCANRCQFCWRGYKAPVSIKWEGPIDEPNTIIDGCMEEHHDLLAGLKGYKKVNMGAYERSKNIRHVALSLTGEPIIYPKINEIISEFHRRKISTFLVTNAQYHEEINNLGPVTQLYLSIGAPNKELLKEIEKPLFPDYWERLHKSLENLAKKKHRTCIRLTMVKDMNMTEPQGYAELIKKGDPDFVEAKAYMFVGASRQRLKLENMPYHHEVMEFTKKLIEYLPDYEIASEHEPSRVVCLAKKKFKKDGRWHTWIDFKRFFHLIEAGEEAADYNRLMPEAFEYV
ncbi:4-demethylwyosine synthase TYW1 [Candidatus Woesearchaeota archaeon]|nr:4-demethylwyosine synthase TYW1 [Candidatus Woesearchaeota archaeon]